MKPTKAPDEDFYGMYGVDDYEGYDEDDFFYHMYFDEVSTTPIPDEFYDLLESVASNNQGANYPDYFDYFDKSIKNRTSDESDSTTVRSARQSKNTRYLNFEKSKRASRRNSKFLSIKSDARIHYSRVMKDNSSESVKVRSKRTTRKRNLNRARQREREARIRSGLRIVRNGSPVIGILDRRTPRNSFFRQGEFLTIALTKFVVLSTGVTAGKQMTGHRQKDRGIIIVCFPKMGLCNYFTAQQQLVHFIQDIINITLGPRH